MPAPTSRQILALLPAFLFFLLLSTTPAAAQCVPAWSESLAPPQFNGDILALELDTAHPASPLYAGGDFTSIGDLAASHIARWDGQTWWPLGEGLNGPVHALALFDEDGPGPLPRSLYAGGDFTTAGGLPAAGLARWDGATWHPVGTGFAGSVRALLGVADGSHRTLYVGGSSLTHASETILGLAAWNGTSWSQVADGLDGEVRALEYFRSQLVAGGTFESTGGGVTIRYIARLIDGAWSPLGSGLFAPAGGQATVNALGIQNNRLFVGGKFVFAGAHTPNIGTWSGIGWAGVHLLGTMVVHDITVESATNGIVYLAGSRDIAGSQPGGTIQWVFPNGMGQNPYYDRPVYAAASRQLDTGYTVYLGGAFNLINQTRASRFAAFGSSASPHPSLGNGLSDTVLSLATLDLQDGGGPALYAGGNFRRAGGEPLSHFVQWNGTDWSTVIRSINLPIAAITAFDDDGDGPNPSRLYIAGLFSSGPASQVTIGRRDDSGWTTIGNFYLSHPFLSMTTFDDGSGPALYLGGAIPESLHGSNLLKWDGQAWTPIGGGVNGVISAMTVFDDDADGPRPPALYLGGFFSSAGPVGSEVPAQNIVRWDGAAWSPLGGGVGRSFPSSLLPVQAMTVFDDDGPGPRAPALYAAGTLDSAGGSPAASIARWDGLAWSPLGDGIILNPTTGRGIRALTVHNDGAGPALIAAGRFDTAGAVLADNIARWNGANWSPLGLGAGPTVHALATFDEDGPGPLPPALYAGGSFQVAGGHPSLHIARWGTPSPIPSATSGPQVAISGSAAEFVATATGAPDLTYQWRRDGQPLADGPHITGAASPRLTIHPTTQSDAGLYDALITNPCGQTSAPPATLTVLCSADWDQDGQITGADIAAYLQTWLAAVPTASPAADFNADGATNSADISAFLTAWITALQTGC